MRIVGSLIVIAILLAAPALAKRTEPGISTLTIGPDMMVNGSMNGTSTRFLMSLWGERTLFLHPDAASRMSFKPGMFKVRGQVGSEKFPGASAVKTYLVDGQPIKRRIVWFSSLFTPGADGVISPGAVPQEVIIAQLRPRRDGERVTTLPLISFPGTYGKMGTNIRIGDSDVKLVWDLTRNKTLVTASAAADLAANSSGHFVGEKFRERVVYNVQRPVRRMVIDNPFVVGPLRLSDVTAWVGDYGDTSQVPDDQADPNEIVVVGKNSKIKPIRAILVGRNDMMHCSSITLDKRTLQIRLSCLS
jgi:hypothetical protein